MGETQIPDFYDFGIFEPVTKPRNQLFLSLEIPGHLNNYKKFPNLLNNVLWISEFWNSQSFDIFEKAGAEQW